MRRDAGLTRPDKIATFGARNLQPPRKIMQSSAKAARLAIPDLAGKAVLITGASTGIGAALARGFAGSGLARRDPLSFERSGGQGARQGAEGRGRRVRCSRSGDVTDPEACARIVEDSAGAFRRARRAHQQCRPDARPGAVARSERRTYFKRHRPQRALGLERHPRGPALARAQGRLRHQYARPSPRATAAQAARWFTPRPKASSPR